MAIDKLDWFPIYWQRFIIGTLDMTAEEIGAYFLLLIYQWDKGFIPEDHKEIKKISKVSVKKLDKVLKKFEKINGKLFNDTLEIIRIEQTEKHAANSAKGKKGAEARWLKHKLSIAQALPEHDPGNGIRVEENREEENRGEERREKEPAPELKFNYMINGEEVLSVDETFKENFPILLNDLNSLHGELKIKNWMKEFGQLHKQKSWKDMQDFRHHVSNYIRLSSEKENNKNGAIKKLTSKNGSVGGFGNI